MNETVIDITSEYTIDTLGLINEGRSQLCTVEYSRVNITHRFFNYTLDSKSIILQLSDTVELLEYSMYTLLLKLSHLLDIPV